MLKVTELQPEAKKNRKGRKQQNQHAEADLKENNCEEIEAISGYLLLGKYEQIKGSKL